MKDEEGAEIIQCKEYDTIRDWHQDPNGYFTIMPFINEGLIKVRFYTNDNKRKYLFVGKTPQDLYWEITQRGLISKMEHAAYLGKELAKAYIALKNKIHYNQDDDLDLTKEAINYV